MKTYQDFQKAISENADLTDLVRSIINDYKGSPFYNNASIADEYNRRRNRTIIQYQKLLYKMSGEAVPDNYSANYKLCSNFFHRFVVQQNQYLLGNGVTWNEESTQEKVGDDFDIELQKAGEYAIVHAVSYGFWNLDHLEVFSALEFVPLWDEEDGSLKAGIRFWQIDGTKPLRATLYEMDGYTSIIWREGEHGEILHEKQNYILKVRETKVDGQEIYDGENYPTFPIVPLWANKYHQSEFVGMQENIDAYDLIKSGFANDLDDASQIYWTIQNAGGMDDLDLAKFIDRMKTVKAAVIEDDGAKAESHTMEIPYEAREKILDRLRGDMYEDFMALDVKNIADGATTATQIKAAYEPLNQKADAYEYCILDFINGILSLAGIDDKPTFTRSIIINTQETIQVLLQSSEYLPEDYITKKILDLFGDGEKVEEILKDMDVESMQRFSNPEEDETDDKGNTEDVDVGIDIEGVNEDKIVDQAEDVSGKALNGAQTQSLILIMDKLGEGGLTTQQAINMISVSIGISKEKAKEIVEGL